jgi:diadenosine tetraphosphatase ApaH/serine/threonine PP2A family protein phosphatase
VGYYTHPNEVLDKVRELQPEISILGNHEALLLKETNNVQEVSFREDSVVTEVIKRHALQLTVDNLEFIKTFQNHVVRDSWEVTHGAIRSQWEYITTLQNAQANMPLMKTDLCFVGHTHVPKVYAHLPEGDKWRTMSFTKEITYRIPPKARIIFNPGSVGQPRDGIPLASYAIFDEDNRAVELFRVPYDLTGMQRSVREQGYPEALAARLSVGK